MFIRNERMSVSISCRVITKKKRDGKIRRRRKKKNVSGSAFVYCASMTSITNNTKHSESSHFFSNLFRHRYSVIHIHKLGTEKKKEKHNNKNTLPYLLLRVKCQTVKIKTSLVFLFLVRTIKIVSVDLSMN